VLGAEDAARATTTRDDGARAEEVLVVESAEDAEPRAWIDAAANMVCG
jgi:hypothetical protein